MSRNACVTRRDAFRDVSPRHEGDRPTSTTSYGQLMEEITLSKRRSRSLYALLMGSSNGDAN